jgi:predicted acyl esterase
MRDDIKLFTIVADLHKPGRYPCVVIRSPYGPDGTENLNDLYLPFGKRRMERMRPQTWLPSPLCWHNECFRLSSDLIYQLPVDRPQGFVVVQQNQRGTGDSGGNFTFWANAPADEADTIAWIVQQVGQRRTARPSQSSHPSSARRVTKGSGLKPLSPLPPYFAG